MPPDSSVQFTVFAFFNDAQGERCKAGWRAFVDTFRQPGPREARKEDHTLFAPATFAGDYRSGETFEHAFALGFDVDEAPVPSIDDLQESVGNLRAIFYSSYSHTTALPRGRLLLALSRPVTAAEYRRIWPVVAKGLGFPVGQAAKDPGRQWYVATSGADGSYVFKEFTGEPVDVDAILADLPPVTAPADGARTSNAPVPVDVTTEVGRKRVELGRQACAEMPAVADDSAGTPLLRVAIHLVRTLELPLDVAHELIATLYNPRCVKADGVTPYPWSDKEIAHKLLDARDKSEKPCGDATPIDTSKFGAPTPAPAPKRKQKNPAHRYTARLGDKGNTDPSATTIGKVISDLATHADWEGVLQYDAFRDRIIAVDPPIALQAEKTCFAEHDVTAVRCWFERVGRFKVAKDTAWDAVIGVARENSFHPVREYLEGLAPQSPALLENAARLFFCSDDELDATLVAKFMVGAVRRIFNPGEKMDTMLVLAGPQGVGKSTFVRALFGEDWTSEDLADLKSKDAMIGLAGKWAIEVAELDKILRTDPETVKAFLTRCVDPYRAPYERVSTDHPRQCVYVGTTNGEDFLKDPTGERRYWVVKVDSVDLAAVRANRDVLWAAAYAAARLPKSEYPHWLTEGEATKLKERAASFESRDPWHEKIVEFLAGKKSVSTTEVWRYIGGMTEGLGRREQLRITDTLLRVGCDSFQQKGCKRYKVPAALSSQPPKRAPGDRPEVS